MRPLALLTLYLLVVLVGGALLAPGLYFLLKSASADFSFLERLSHQPISRFVNRAMIILAVAGIWPLARKLGQKNVGELGLKPVLERKKFLPGFSVGFVSLALIAALTLLFKQRAMNLDYSGTKLCLHFLNATLAALIVAVIEELIFRAIIFGGLKKAFSWGRAAVMSSALYALVHFFARTPSPENVNWLSGLVVLGQMFSGFTDVHTLVPGFFNLFLAGMILATAYQITGTLYFSMGVHAGWIFWLKSFGFFTRQTAPETSWLWGTSKLIDGWSSAIVLGLLLIAFLRYQKRSADVKQGSR